MHHKFFVSSGTSFQTVCAVASAHTWADFVSSTLASPVEIPLTRSEYAALPPADQKDAKRGPYFVPAHFHTSPSPRRAEHAAGVSLVCLDVDNSDHARLVLERGDPILPCQHAVYHTASSTDAAPRLRVVVPAPPGATVAQYPSLVRALANGLGLPSVTPESTVAVQAMYRPALFVGEDLMGLNPLVSVRATGPTFDFGAFSGSTPVQRTPRLDLTREIEDSSALQFLAAPVDGVTIEGARAMLDHLDPDLPRDKWLRVMCALQHQFPGSEEALELFIEWSAKGTKFPGHEDVAREWRTRKPNAAGKASFTMRGLIRMAREAGYSTETAPDTLDAYTRLHQWIKSPERTVEDLTHRAAERISRLPTLGDILTASLIDTVDAALKSRGFTGAKVSVRRAVRRIQTLAKLYGDGTVDQAIAPKEAHLPAWARGLCYVKHVDRYFDRREGMTYTSRAIDSAFSREFCAPGESHPSELPSNYLLNVLRCTAVEDFIYLPSSPEPFPAHPLRPSESALRYVNTYRPTFVPADTDPEHIQAAGELVTAHLAHLITEPEHRVMLLDWMAYQVQNPGAKIRWAVVLQGAQGCGKTLLVHLMEAALGKGNVRSVSGSNVVNSSYNEWMEGAQVIALEEIRVSGHNRTEIMNALKPAITNNTLSINQKFRDTREAYNVANYLLLTNHHDALAVDDGDRRYFILQSALQTKEQVTALPQGHFPAMFDLVRNRPGAVRAFFESHPVSEAFPVNGPAPVTHYARRMSAVTGSPVARAVKEALELGDPRVSRELCSLSELRTLVAQENELGDDKATDRRLTLALAELGLHRCGRVRVGEQRVTVWSDTLPEDDTSGLVEAYTAAVEMAALMGVAVSI